MKNKLIAVLFGLFLFVPATAPVYASTIQQSIDNGLKCGSNLEIPTDPNQSCGGVSSASNSLEQVVKRLVNILSWIIGVVAVIMIMIGGFRYVTSGGSDSSVTSAKNTILYAIIGLVIVALSQVLVHFTIKSLSG